MKLRGPLGSFSPGTGPPKHNIFFLILNCEFGAPPRNSGPNPMSFQFLTGGRLTQVDICPSNLRTLETRMVSLSSIHSPLAFPESTRALQGEEKKTVSFCRARKKLFQSNMRSRRKCNCSTAKTILPLSPVLVIILSFMYDQYVKMFQKPTFQT